MWYRVTVAAAAAAGPLVALANDKLRRGITGRRGLLERMAAWGTSHRDRRRPLVWFHAPSVGEGLQTRPVIERLRAECPDWQIVYTFFSPSAAGFAKQLAVDYADYLPLDRSRDVVHALEALAPTALVYGKLDVWPELTLAAQRRGVRLGLVAATVAPRSGRLSWPVRGWSAPAYAAIERIGAIATEDAERLKQLGARRDAIRVTGDTRYDSVTERAGCLDRTRQPFAALARSSEMFTIVAGSTWPSDEDVLLPAYADLLRSDPVAPMRLVLVPHEPTPSHLDRLDAAAHAAALPRPVRTSGAAELAGAKLVVVDQVGVLADLYALAQVAYVGGGYHRAGLHSVLEPAVWGVPLSVGPRWGSSRDAGLLIGHGAALPLPRDGREALTRQWQTWRTDATARDRAGRAAAALVKDGTGAAERTTALVRLLVEGERS
ncbi:MAG TPA: glycosyltransferase N-terminal domain-containing protein [Gemmatimonadales bacterium]|nr:glycosyltransferase N-terminal domain-containing protein [Gemmatimonadales bacterium]